MSLKEEQKRSNLSLKEESKKKDEECDSPCLKLPLVECELHQTSCET